MLWLEKLGAEVLGLSLPPATQPALWTLLGGPGGANSFGDVRDPTTVRTAFESARPEIVIHMAAQALVRASHEDPVSTFQTNVMGVVNVLEAARATPTVRAIVNVTSDKCYENREQIWAYREDEPMGGADPYSASKGCAELATSAYRRSYFNRSEGPWLASGRAGNVIGGGDWSPDRLIPDGVRAFTAGETLRVRNPSAIRPWQHVLEPINGYLLLARALCDRGREVAEAWNFGPSEEDAWSVGQIVERFTAAWGGGASWRRDEVIGPAEAMLLRLDATKARQRLDWRPRLSISEGLDWTVEWYKSVAAGQSAHETTMSQIEAFERRSVA
jgi:CDP-glucose 4,6-dehydratase